MRNYENNRRNRSTINIRLLIFWESMICPHEMICCNFATRILLCEHQDYVSRKEKPREHKGGITGCCEQQPWFMGQVHAPSLWDGIFCKTSVETADGAAESWNGHRALRHLSLRRAQAPSHKWKERDPISLHCLIQNHCFKLNCMLNFNQRIKSLPSSPPPVAAA